MVPLFRRLVELLQELQLGPRTFPDALRDLLRALAAQGIQEDPAQAVAPPGPGEVLEAIEHGAREAERLNDAGLQLHIEVEALPLATASGHPADRPTTSFGPFVDRSGRLLRFSAFESPALLRVVVRSFVAPDETVLLIPANSSPTTGDLQHWTLPAGSVWIRARFLVPGSEHFAGLRIASGTLDFTGGAAISRDATSVVASTVSPWTLTIEPEPGEAPASGSDASALSLTLPDQLVVHANAAPEVTGAVSLSGFGSGIVCDVAPLAPTVFDQLCLFPLTARDDSWTIAGNRSATAQFDGTARIESPFWALPISPIDPGSILAAPHGGSLVARLTGDVKSAFAGITGQSFTWFVSTLTANARRLELNGLQVMPGGRGEVELWSRSRSLFTFGQQALGRLLFRSERDGIDAVGIAGGRQRNLWDHPQQSDATPFPFEGTIDLFGLVAFVEGIVLVSAVSGDEATGTAGLALENLYVIVRPPKRCALVAAFDPDTGSGPAGISFLLLDARFAIPTLPDPYAANTQLRDHGDTFQEALRIELEWIWSRPPSVRVHLDGPLRFAIPHAPVPEGDDEHQIANLFRGFLDAPLERTLLLDLSSREHLFGVALEAIDDNTPPEHRPAIDGNRLALPLNRVRLFMQPQVHWEPVWPVEEPKANPPLLVEGPLESLLNGGLTLVGARGNDQVATLPAAISQEILAAIRNQRRAAALFSLPFGLRAMARLSPDEDDRFAAGVDTRINEPDFGHLRSAQQMRLIARNPSPNEEDPSRQMPGQIHQLQNLNRSPVTNPGPHANSVLGNLTDTLNGAFPSTLPLHRADLSGYGLSTFSEWCRRGDDDGNGVIKVQFEVLNGRAAYEVIQVRTRLWECGARVVRTITMERRNSASVVLTDSGWVPIEDGEFKQPIPFEKGMVRAFRRIRRITITAPPFDIAPNVTLEPVVFDADVDIDALGRGGTATVPLLNRPGYVHIPKLNGDDLDANRLKLLFEKVGPITSPIDATVRVSDTLRMQVTSVTSDFAPGDGLNNLGFAVAGVGAPQLPRAAQWSAVRIDPATSAAFSIDVRRGVPIVRNGAGPFLFREPADARRAKATLPYGLLMATQASRVLFPEPKLKPDEPRRLAFDPPLLADPYSLVQSTSAFPPAAAALRLQQAATFSVLDDAWRIENPEFAFATPAPDLLNAAEWSMSRTYPNAPVHLDVNSALPTSWNIAVPPSNLNLTLPDPLNDIFVIRAPYAAASGGLPTLPKPTLDFIGPLAELKKIVDTLSHLVDVGLNVDVNVTAAGSGATPSFLVQLRLIFKLGKPEERVDIGVGKFFGQFLLEGNLEVGTSGIAKAPRLFLEFKGDIQQGIIPPLLYAGGLFRFGIEIPPSGRPTVQLAIGVVASVGGDLIKGLVEAEITVHYGYLLIPETLQPGVLVGLDARAKLLGGLFGFSFGVEAMARIQRLVGTTDIRIWAHIRVAASVQIAWLLEEEVDFETQFEQNIPLELATIAAGGGLAGLIPALQRI